MGELWAASRAPLEARARLEVALVHGGAELSTLPLLPAEQFV